MSLLVLEVNDHTRYIHTKNKPNEPLAVPIKMKSRHTANGILKTAGMEKI